MVFPFIFKMIHITNNAMNQYNNPNLKCLNLTSIPYLLDY